MFSRLIFIVGAALALSHQTMAFSPSTPDTRSNTSLQATTGRRAFVGAVVASIILASPVFAEEGTVDDLAMPSEQEQKDEVGLVCLNRFV